MAERHKIIPVLGARLRAQSIQAAALWVVALLLVGCTLAPARRQVLPQGAKAGGRSAAQQLAAAEELFHRGRLEEARNRYTELARAYPRSPKVATAWLRQGEIDFRLGRYAQAASHFQKVINRFAATSESEAARLWLLRCYLGLKRYNDAVETGKSLVTYLRRRAQQAEAAAIVADAEQALGQYPEAVRWYSRAYGLAEEQSREVLTSRMSRAIRRLGRESVSSMLAEYPEGFPRLQLLTRLAEIEMESGQLAQAQQRLEGLLEKRPEHPLAATWKNMLARVQEWLQVDMTAVGCLLPLSGRYQAYGERVLRGLTLALQEAQSLGGRAEAIRLVVEDTGDQSARAAAAVKDLVETHRVAGIIGPLGHLAAESAAGQAQQFQIPIITLTQQKGIGHIGNYVFRDFLSNEEQARALAEYAVLGLGYRRFAILYPKDGYGIRLLQLFWDELDRLGAEVRGVEGYEPSQTDFADQIKRLVGLYYPRVEESQESQPELPKENEPGPPVGAQEEQPLPVIDFEAIFVPDSYKKVGLIAPQLAYYDVTGVKLLGTNLWHSPELLKMAAPYLEGAVFVDGFFAGNQSPLSRHFVRNYEGCFGERPGYPAAQAYDSMRLLLRALAQPGVLSRPQLRDALLAIRALPGVTGEASVGPQGEVRRSPLLITVQGGQLAEVQMDFATLEQRQEGRVISAGGKPEKVVGKRFDAAAGGHLTPRHE